MQYQIKIISILCQIIILCSNLILNEYWQQNHLIIIHFMFSRVAFLCKYIFFPTELSDNVKERNENNLIPQVEKREREKIIEQNRMWQMMICVCVRAIK